MSHQSIQPNLVARLQRKEDDGVSYFLADDDAYIGGTSLLIAAEGTQERQIPLYQLNYDATNGCEVQFVYKSPEPDMQSKVQIYLNLRVTDVLPDELAYYWHDVAATSPQPQATTASRLNINEDTSVYLNTSKTQELAEGWVLCSVRVPSVHPLGEAAIEELGIYLDGTEDVLFRLGLLTIVPYADTSSTLASKITHIQLQRDADVSSKCLSSSCELWATLSWMMESNSSEEWNQVDHYLISYGDINADGAATFLGTTFTTEYRISGLEMKNDIDYIQISAVSRLGNILAQQTIGIQ